MLIATKSSPLYPFNDWVDTNASFTMGKAMMNGRVLYRDIFDQRGPLLYFLYGLAYLIANTSFIGVFIFEVLSFSIFLFFSYKIFLLFLDAVYTLISLPILAFLILNLNSFSHGGSPEELCLPLVAIGLYHILAYFKNLYPEPMPYRWVLINGIIAGCVVWIKYSLLGFWIGWMFSILIIQFFKHSYSRAIKSSLLFISGMLLATIPWVIYFGVNNAILDFIKSYFVINITNYSRLLSLETNIGFVLIGIIIPLLSNPLSIGLLYFGLIVFIIHRKFSQDCLVKMSILFCFFFLSLSVYGGGRGYVYYSFIFSPFIIFGFIVIFQTIYDKFDEIRLMKFIYIIIGLVFGLISYTLLYHHNIEMINLNKEDLVQYQYAKIINQNKDATLLNYGSLDGGFYTTTGIVPKIKFFQNLNIDYSRYPVIMDEQNRYIKEQLVDFIVIRIEPNENFKELDIPYLDINYKLIEKQLQEYENKEFNYLLFIKEN